MAVRWSAGEETLTTCNMDIFPLETLDETNGIRSGGTLDTLQGCLYPTILSMFEDTPVIESRDLEDETETTLLTALTEILDNVDDENLSPFDTLPESDLLSGQKGREHSPLRRLFCLSRSPPEKEVIFGKSRSTGKTLPMAQQRSDGEEEDSLTPSPERLEFSSDNELLDWEGLPITLEQHGADGLSVNLGDLVRHMHPYCMAISLEDDKGEQMLPEGGILLEVVDQGENGEPILAIPEMDHPISVKLDETSPNLKALDETDDQASDTSEHIVVDDDSDDNVKPQLKDQEKKNCSNVMNKLTIDGHNDDLSNRNASQRKTRSKINNYTVCSQLSESRVLRSASVKRGSHKRSKKSEKKLLKKDHNVPQNLDTSTTSTFTKPKNISQIKRSESNTLVAVPVLPVSSKDPEKDPSESPPHVEFVQQCETVSNFSAPAAEKEEGIISGVTGSKGASSTSVDQAASPELTHTTESMNKPSLPLSPAVIAEPKPKALSLTEYRRLRQQRKPAPIEKRDDNSTKWPSLPEMPRELPPIPHLPEPSSRDPRRSRLQSKEVEEVKPAWMPRGPCAPPTPEALLAPPAYMVNSTVKKVCAASFPNPQQTIAQTVPSQHCDPQSTSGAFLHTQETTKGFESCAVDSPQTCQTSATTTTDEIKPAATLSTSKSYNTIAPTEIRATLNATEDPVKSTDSGGQGVSSPESLVKLSNHQTPDVSEKCLAVNPLQLKSPTQKLIKVFTSEMGIEATDLTSLLEQFEETQAKEEQCVPEVSGRAVAVGNSSTDLNSEKTDVERVRANDLSCTALTPPATPPHPLWKPLIPVSLLGKSKTAETKSGLSKVIQIEAQPLPLTKARGKFTPAAPSVTPDMACQDHDYCLPNNGTFSGEAGNRWNVKHNSSITIKPIKQPSTPAQQNIQAAIVQSTRCAAKIQSLDLKTEYLDESSVLETPDASPTRDIDYNSTSLKQRPFRRVYRQRATSPTPSPKRRSVGRSRVRRSHHSPSPTSNSSESDSSRSRSRSYTPPKKRYRLRRSRSSSSSGSRSRSSSQSRSPSQSPRHRRRHSYSSSRSASWSRSRSRSPQWSRKRLLCSPSHRDLEGTNVKMNHEMKRRKEKAIEERRVVYVGRIRGTMTQKELKERFSYFGEIEECTLHFRDHGDNYGFVTYYNTNDAFMAIENGSKLRKPDELPFDLCFGGRRQFCQTSYADLDSNKEYEPLPSRNKNHALDFDTLLKQAQQNLKR